MDNTIILADKQDEANIVEEERHEWLLKVLVALGANLDIIKNNTLEAKNHISSIGLDVILKSDGEIDIYRYEYDKALNEDGNVTMVEKGNYLVAQWLKPKYILRVDGNEKFYEIHIKEWSLPFQMVKLGE